MSFKRGLALFIAFWMSVCEGYSVADSPGERMLEPQPGFLGGAALVLLNSAAGFCGYGGWEYADSHRYYFRTLTAEGYGDWILYDDNYGEAYHTLKTVYNRDKGQDGFDSTGRAVDWQSAYCVEMGVDLDGDDRPAAESTDFTRLRRYGAEGWKGLCLTVLYGCAFQGEISVDGGALNIRMLTPFPDDFPPNANEVDWYMATNMILYEFVMGLRDLSGYVQTSGCPAGADELKKELKGSPADRVYDWMIGKISRHAQAPSFLSADPAEPPSVLLTWSEENQRYETQLEDLNHTELDLSSWTQEAIAIEQTGANLYRIWTHEDLSGRKAAVQKKMPVRTGQTLLLWNSGTDKQTLLTGTITQDPLIFSGVFSTEQLPGQIRGIKTDEKGRGLAGAVIGLFQGQKECGRTLSQSDGSWKFENIPWGGYTIREISAPPGYENTLSAYEVSIDGQHRDITLEPIINTPRRGTAKILKKSEDGSVEGFEFQLDGVSYTGEEVHLTAVTDSTGCALFANVLAGTYAVSEVRNERSAPYVTPPSQQAEIKGGSACELSFYNRLKKGTVQLTKLDAEKTDKRLSGAVFEVTREGRRAGILKEQEPGFYVLDQLRAGSYELKEIEPPDFYTADQTMYSFTIVEDGEVIQIENDPLRHGFVNKRAAGSLHIQKTAQVNPFKEISLEGFQFKVRGETDTGEEWEQDFTTDSKGEIEVGGLPTGTYTITEIVSDKTEGFLLPEAQTVRVDADCRTAVEFENRWIRGSVRLMKTDAEFEDRKLSGAVFAIQSLDQSVQEQLREEEDGIYRYDDLPYGDYIIREIQPPEHYAASDISYPVAIRREGEEISIAAEGCAGVVNEPERGGLIIRKEVEQDTYLNISPQGFHFRITGTADTGQSYDQTLISDESGQIIIENLRTGTYTVSEVADPLTEIVFETPKPVTVRIEAEKISEVCISNQLRRGALQILKLSSETQARALSGAEFVLEIMQSPSPISYTEAMQANGEWREIGRQNTDEDGRTEFSGLTAGQYRLREIRAPEGYELLPSPIYIQIPSEEGDYRIRRTISNEPSWQMPSAGGNGLSWAILSGIGLCGSAAAIILGKRRKGKCS